MRIFNLNEPVLVYMPVAEGCAPLEGRVGAAGSRGTARLAGREAESTLENAFSLFQ